MSAKDLRLPPPALLGDIVAIAATSRPVREADVSTAVKLWESAGYCVQLAKNIGFVNHVFAGTVEQRVAALQVLLDDPAIRVIHFAKGGYGIHQILNKLDWVMFLRYPKWLVGFSDLTLLLTQLQAQGVQGIHGPMAACFDAPERAEAFRLLEQSIQNQSIISELKLLYHPEEIIPEYVGKSTGGNLSLLQTCLGTSLQLVLEHAEILLIEEVDEYLYAIDRLLRHLEMSGIFAGKKAIIVGGLDWIKDNPEPYGFTAEGLFVQLGRRVGVPILLSERHGHGAAREPFRLGANTTIFKDVSGRWLMQQD